MDSRARRFLSWTFIIAFFALAPVIILSTAGYRYNFERWRLERTGVVVVESRPTGASVNLNGRLRQGETPLRIGRLTPGTYTIGVEKAGFHPWNKTVTVGSQETVFLNRIPLFRSEAPELLNALKDPAATAFSTDARYAAAIASASSGSELIIIDTRSGRVHLPYRSSVPASAFRLHWAPNEALLLVERAGPKPAFLLWDADQAESVRDLAAAAPLPFTDALWAQDTDRLYAVARGTLYEIDLASHAATPKGASLSEPVITGGALYGIRDAQAPLLARRGLDGEAFETVAQLPHASFAPVAARAGRITYASRNDDRLFVIDPSSTPPAAFESRGRDGAWSADGSRLLYWNDLEVRLYDKNAGTDELINRLSQPIILSAWQRPEWAVLYASGNELHAIETADRFGRADVRIAEFDALHNFAVNPNGDAVFLFGEKNGAGALWKLRLR